MDSVITKERSTFLSGEDSCVGYVYRSHNSPAPHPAVVMAHGFGGTQEGSLARTAEDFSRAGFVVLTFDYRNFGESDGAPRQVISIPMQLEDWHAAIAHARALPGVDPTRVAIWGSSLSGGHVVEVAAQDRTLAAVIAQVPFNGFPNKVEGRTRRETWRLMRAILKDWWNGKRGREPFYIPVVGRRGELAVMAFDEAEEIIHSMENKTWRNQVAPRVLLDMLLWYRPGRKARRLGMPILVCLAERDQQTPPRLGSKIAEKAPLGELRRYSCTHFDFYKEPIRSRIAKDQISFLATHLLASDD